MKPVATLSGALLDYWTARADGREARILAPVVLGPGSPPAHQLDGAVCYANAPEHPNVFEPFQPSTMWLDCGGIIDREKIGTTFSKMSGLWHALVVAEGIAVRPTTTGSTAQIAACRAFIALRLGNEVDEVN